MNRKQRRVARSQDKPEPVIRYRGKSYTIEEAGILAEKEQSFRNFQAAADIYNLILAQVPDYGEVYSNLGVVLQKMKRYGEALSSYDKAIAFNPGTAGIYFNRGTTLQQMNRHEEALASYDKAIKLKPDYAEAHNNRSVTLKEIMRYDESLAAAEKAIALAPGYAAAYQNRGSVLMDMGEMEEAERMFLRALALAPEDPAPLFNLAGLRRYEDADHADAKVIRAMLAKPGATAEDKEYLYFALGKIYDDCGWWDEAFECYRQANRIRSESVPYDAEATAATTRGIMEVFSRGFLAQKCEFGSDSKSPVFIVGMPRSGTTLMASILSSHPCVATAGELPTVRSLAAQLPELTGNGTLYPGAAKHITPAIAAHLSKTYEARLRRDASPDVPYVIDKHPLNFMHLGLIAMLFPGAHAIHCTRDPLDTGLSNYFQRFSRMYEYASDLTSIGHFYGEYAKLMEHWHNVLPVKMLEVSYEDMVADTEKTARKALDFLGLAWDARCLSPHTNPSPVETASNWQVRQPIYRQSIERWRHYEKHLAPLKEALGLKGWGNPIEP